jgi:hypothetical protein
MKNFNEFINEAVNYKDRSGKPFKIKEINFIYTEQGGRFYGTYLYDGKPGKNHNSKIGYDESKKLLKSLGIKEELPKGYGPGALDKICKELKKKGIVGDHGDYMDVS